MKAELAIIKGEVKNLFREPELIFLIVVPFLIGFILRAGIPFAEVFLSMRFGFDLSPYINFITGFIMLVPALLIGMVSGLRMLDDRDGGILRYTAVLPIASGRYLFCRLIISAILAAPLSGMLPLIQGVSGVPILPLGMISLSMSLSAPALALFLTAFAGNKVEAMALAKISGILFAAPAAGFFIKSPLIFIAGILPPFWAPLTFVRIMQGESWRLWVLAGCCVQLLWLIFFIQRFTIKVRQRL